MQAGVAPGFEGTPAWADSRSGSHLTSELGCERDDLACESSAGARLQLSSAI
jgi:hypothetical protein